MDGGVRHCKPDATGRHRQLRKGGRGVWWYEGKKEDDEDDEEEEGNEEQEIEEQSNMSNTKACSSTAFDGRRDEERGRMVHLQGKSYSSLASPLRTAVS